MPSDDNKNAMENKNITTIAHNDIKAYFKSIDSGSQAALKLANEARKKGHDFADHVEMTLAPDVAGRVEGIVGPKGIAEMIRSLVAKKMSRDEVAFEIAKMIAKQEYPTGLELEARLGQAVRTGLAILTEGVLVAPTEGISAIKIEKNPDGSSYLAIYFSGPIRSAGGTAAAQAVLLGDYVRKFTDIGDFIPTETELLRYVEEINLYDARCAHLQYLPPDEDIKWIFRHCKICIAGDPTHDNEVSVYRGLERMKTNRVRSGVALVSCEGIAQKARKVLKFAKKYELDWSWLEKLIKEKKKEDKMEIKPNDTFLEGLVAGRPIFAYPSTKGGFRLRYGRTRFTGIAAKAIHPATMVLLDYFPALGTQFKIERPGKGTVVTPCDSIMGPIVKLKNGDVVYVSNTDQAKLLYEDVDKILFLGDMLITYGDFFKSNHVLLPSPFVEEIWALLAAEKSKEGSTPDAQAAPASATSAPGTAKSEQAVSTPGTASATSAPGTTKAKHPITAPTTAREAFELSRSTSLPLYPTYLYFWSDLSRDELLTLVESIVTSGTVVFDWFDVKSLTITDLKAKPILEMLGIPHKLRNNEILLEGDDAYSLLATLGMLSKSSTGKLTSDAIGSSVSSADDDVCAILTKASGVDIRRKSTYYIGARMGRPEKADDRKMAGSVHGLFPLGNLGGKLRNVNTAIKSNFATSLNADLVELHCPKCNAISFQPVCQSCGSTIAYDTANLKHSVRPVDFKSLYEKAVQRCDSSPEGFRLVMGLTNSTKIPEALEKGLLRAKHGVCVFKDGTCRFDSTDLTATHFKPREIGTSVDKLRSLGYTHDASGSLLQSDDQIVELFPQDIILSENSIDFFLRLSHFIDDFLIHLYGMHPFYNAKARDDLVGHLFITLSPHTSAGVVGRLIGFVKGRVGISHPYVVCARRRNCFHPTTRVRIWDGQGLPVEETLEEITEKLMRENPEMIRGLGQGMEKIDLGKEWYVNSIDPYTRAIVKRKIQCFMRTKSPEYWVKITTKTGMECTVTPDHNFLCIENDTLIPVQADKIRENAIIPVHNGHINEPAFKFSDSCAGDQVIKVEKVYDKRHAYCLDIETETDNLVEKNVLLENGIFCIRCDGDEDTAMLLMDAFLNFSKLYLPETRGATMDASIVLTTIVDPSEVDDEVHAMEVVKNYSLDFYKAAAEYKPPSAVKPELVENRLGSERAFYSLDYTHEVSDINDSPVRSEYVLLKTMKDKLDKQFSLYSRLRAVDAVDGATRLLSSHFIPDIYGNLRSFSRQTFRCGGCNNIYRRVPLCGKCEKCGGKLLLTINKGGIEKYIKLAKYLITKYGLPEYTMQRLERVEKEISSIFEDETKKQSSLAQFL